MKRKLFRVCAVLAVAALGIAFGPAAFAQEISIVVHKSNAENFSPESLRNYFTGKKTHFENGKEVMIVDQAGGAAARPTFLNKVVGMSSTAWDQYWLEQKSKSGRPKPKQTKSVKFILRLVSRKPGAIGYVSIADLTEKSKGLVRVVFTVK